MSIVRERGSYSIEGFIEVGQGLRLDAFGGVHQEEGALAAPDTPVHLVAEVHVTRGVNQVQKVLMLGPVGVHHSRCLCDHGDASLAFHLQGSAICSKRGGGVSESFACFHIR